MRLIRAMTIFTLCLFLLTACSGATGGSGASDGNDGTGEESDQKFTRENLSQLLTDPKRYKGASVDVVGKVFGEVEVSESGVAWQMWGDPKKSEFNIAVAYAKPGFAIRSDDFVHVVGVVNGELKGKNAFGAEIVTAIVQATSAEVVDALAAAPPALKTAATNATQEQKGLSVTVEKIEFAAEETRVFLSINNGTGAKVSFYTFNAKLVQGSTQIEPESSFDEYPEVQSELLPGVKSSGVIAFAKVDSTQAFRLVFEASSDNYETQFDPFDFEIAATP